MTINPTLPMELYTQIIDYLDPCISLALLNKTTSQLYLQKIYSHFKLKDNSIGINSFYPYYKWVTHLDIHRDFKFGVNRRLLKEFTNVKSISIVCPFSNRIVMVKKMNVVYNAVPQLLKVGLRDATDDEVLLLSRFTYLQEIELYGWNWWPKPTSYKLKRLYTLVVYIEIELRSEEILRSLLTTFTHLKRLRVYNDEDDIPFTFPMNVPCVVEELKTMSTATTGYPTTLKKLNNLVYSSFKLQLPMMPLHTCELVITYLPTQVDLSIIVPYLRSCTIYDVLIMYLGYQTFAISNINLTYKPIHKNTSKLCYNPIRIAKVDAEWIYVPMHGDNIEYTYYGNEEYFETADFTEDHSNPTTWYSKCCVEFGHEVHGKIMELYDDWNTKYIGW